jgi:hypothetical protein
MSEEAKPYSVFLLGAGLLASVFWFGKSERRLPREFGGISRKRGMSPTKRKLSGWRAR